MLTGRWSHVWSLKPTPFDAPLYGMALFDVNSSGVLELERDDEAGAYSDDDKAWEEFIGILKGQSIERERAIRMAVTLLENWREPMAAVARGENPNEE